MTAEVVIEQVKRLKQAFPSLPAGYYDILMDRVKEKKFTDTRLRDAINNLIDTCRYPTPTIADIISWDKRIKLYSYEQIREMVNQAGSSVFDNYKAVRIPEFSRRMYASVIDIETYNLELA